MQESGYDKTAIKYECGLTLEGTTSCIFQDFGISQVNYKTAKSYNLDTNKLTSDIEYAVNAGAMVLSDLKKMFPKDKNWWSSYNCGTKKPLTRKTCAEYKRLVSRFL
jgi:hypothetical protein